MDYRVDELQHHGVLGQKWGVRRWQNEDGTLTEAGKVRIRKDATRLERRQAKAEKRQTKYANKLDKFNRLNNKRFFKNEEKIGKAATKMSRANSKYVRAINRANKYWKKMEKRYGNNLVSNLSATTVRKGEAFAIASMSSGIAAASINALNYVR